MQRAWQFACALALWVILSATSAFADGMVVQQVFYPKVEIPNQQALIHFNNNIEQLVIETSFLGKGTNFAWVVPLPAPPKVEAVSEGFFQNLQHSFESHLVQRVTPYYTGFLFICGFAFLGWRALKNEVSWVSDIPLCLLISGGAWYVGHHYIFGILSLIATVYIRLFTRSPAAFAGVMLISLGLAGFTILSGASSVTLMATMGEDGNNGLGAAGVTIVSVQRAGVFDSTTIKGTNPSAVMNWFRDNGYQTPQGAEPAIRNYVKEGWVFVASKVRRDNPNAVRTALHPLAFTFSTRQPVYPTRLTAVNDGECIIDLYVMGSKRAAARHFNVARCDKLVIHPGSDPKTWLRVSDDELASFIGDATVGTKLTATLTPKQMQSDVAIKSSFFRSTGRYFYSDYGAFTIALNVGLPLAVLSWLAAGGIRGGWAVNEKHVWRLRWRLLAISIAVGIVVFWWLPKTEIVSAL